METLAFKGRAWTFGDNVDTDQITLGKYVHLPVEEMSRHAFESLDPSFAKEFQAGDIIVAGANFGCGSSRETAPSVLKHLGAAAVIAESFARIFFRNAIAIGLPVLVCPQISAAVHQGDEIAVDFETASVANLSSREEFSGVPLHEMMLVSLKRGGLMHTLRGD